MRWALAFRLTVGLLLVIGSDALAQFGRPPTPLPRPPVTPLRPVIPPPVILPHAPGPAPRTLDARAIERCWDELADPSALTAIYALIASPREAVELFRVRLQPARPVDPMRLAGLLDKLESDEFETRQEAEGQLRAVGEQLAPFLPKALSAARSLESRRRLEALQQLWTTTTLTGDRLRIVRAIEALERIGSPEARALVQILAKGAPAALITTEATATLGRLSAARR
jgi:hypothetical protein